MSVKTINNITNNFYSDEWYTSEVTAKLAIEKLKRIDWVSKII